MKHKILALISEAVGYPVVEDSVLDSLDSLEFVELIRQVETEFSVRFPEALIAGLNTPLDFIRMIEAIQCAKGELHPATQAEHGILG